MIYYDVVLRPSDLLVRRKFFPKPPKKKYSESNSFISPAEIPIMVENSLDSSHEVACQIPRKTKVGKIGRK